MRPFICLFTFLLTLAAACAPRTDAPNTDDPSANDDGALAEAGADGPQMSTTLADTAPSDAQRINVIEDNFQRADSPTWGTTSNNTGLTNVPWTGPIATATTAMVVADGGVVAWPGSNAFVLGYPGTTAYAGGDVLTALDFTATGQSQAWLLLDATTDGHNHYIAALRTYNNTVVIIKTVAGVATVLATRSFPFTANVRYWARFDAHTGTLGLRVWPDGATEPATWTLSAADSSLTSGQPGVGFNWQSTGTHQQIVLENFAFTTTGYAVAASPGPSNRASPAGCVPTTCLAAGASCGSMPDGCGGTITCGSCPSGTTCGAYAPNSCGHVYYMSPSAADDTGSGSRDEPWKTFNHAVAALQPGDTLTLLDGSYTVATSGMMRANCSSNAHSGTATLPITVRSDLPRHAFVREDGTYGYVILVANCAYWNLVGLHVRSDDARITSGFSAYSVLSVEGSDHVSVYRVFGEYNNRLYNTQVISLINTTNSSVIESEVYNFHRHGMDSLGYTSRGNVFQRNYIDAMPGGACSAHGTSDPNGVAVHCGWDLECYNGLCGNLPDTSSFCTSSSGTTLPNGTRCGWPSHWTGQQGDEAITQYWSAGGFIENNISAHSEGQQATGHGNVISHGVSIAEVFGTNVGRNEECANLGSDPVGTDAAIDEGSNDVNNMVYVNTQETAVQFCGSNDDHVENVSVYGETGHAVFRAYGYETTTTMCQPCLSGLPMSFSASNVAAFVPASVWGGRVEGTFSDPWNGSYVDMWWTQSNGNAYSPGVGASGAHWSNADTNAITGMYNPTTRQGDMLFVPAGASLHGAGAGGGNIGANVTCVYDHGTNTMQPMWHAGDGRFVGCDWYAPGSNDDVAASEGYTEHCATIHTTLNVGTNGGTIPTCMP